MTLRLIGAGFGRMGTRATKDALEMIGFGPCHHMAEVFMHNETVPQWQEALQNPPVTAAGWAPLLGDYAACVDWPCCYFWKELNQAFPDAKVLLSTRDPEEWWASINKTIFEIFRQGDVPEDDTGMRNAHRAMAREMIADRTFGDFENKANVLRTLKAHEEEVRDTIAPERLLTWSVTEGWDPLCAFLDVPVPDTPFPNRNTTKDFRKNIGIDD